MARSSTEKEKAAATSTLEAAPTLSHDAGPINASGHTQELQRNFGIFSIIGLAITSGNIWIALGGTLVVALGNGGPPGTVYEFIAAFIFYCFIAASIAELASAVPSAGGVYHWASITGGPRYGRVIGFFAGWLNFFAWIFSTAATIQIVAAQTTSMYALYHPDLELKRWHVFVTYLILLAIIFTILLYANKILPLIETTGGTLVLVGCGVSVIICLAMAEKNTDAFVWMEWQNFSGYKSDGFVFCLGMLNGAFAFGATDVISHLAEEVPRPSATLAKGIFYEYTIGFISGFAYLITILYCISDFDAVVAAAKTYYFPLTEIYIQATGAGKPGGGLRDGASPDAACGLLLLAFLPFFISMIGCYLTTSRIFWGLARDNATPFHRVFGRVNQRTNNPANAIMFCAVFLAVLGCVYVGSNTAFVAFIGSFVLLSSLSYLLAILPHLLSGRSRVTPGWFWMGGVGKGADWLGYLVNAIACGYIIVFGVIYCFPATPTVTPETMNWTCLLTGGLTLLVLPLWVWKRGEYKGPPIIGHEAVTAKDAL